MSEQRTIPASVVVGGVVALVALAVAAALGAAVAGVEFDRVAYLITALIAPTVVSLLALLKSERIATKLDDVKEQVNGHLKRHQQGGDDG